MTARRWADIRHRRPRIFLAIGVMSLTKAASRAKCSSVRAANAERQRTMKIANQRTLAAGDEMIADRPIRSDQRRTQE